MNARERKNMEGLFRVRFKLQRARVRDDFRKVMHDADPDEDLMNPKNDEFFEKYAGRKVLVFEDDENEWCILEDDNYIIPTSAFKFNQ
jgi:hypothetical protein